MIVIATALVHDPVIVTAFTPSVSRKPSNVATSGMPRVLAVANAAAASSIPVVATIPAEIPSEDATTNSRPDMSLEGFEVSSLRA